MNSTPERKPFFARLVPNWTGLAGAILVIASWFAFFLLFTLDFFAAVKSPYLGILTYLVAPFFFLAGAFLMVVGRIRHRFRARHAVPGAPVTSFTIDISQPRHRKILLGFAFGAAAFLLITAVGSYETYQVTKSVQFCGQACHGPMEPQYVAYQNSPHARVECTACHIGPQAQSFVKAKFNGLHQVYATAFNDFHRPVHLSGKIDINQETCEQCHWPKRHIGNVERNYTHYLADETNTLFGVRLLLKVGGGDPTHGPAGGIHWHMNLANKIEYIATDDKQQVIPWVRFTEANGTVTEYRTAEFKDDPSQHKIRAMDCMVCHNRPAHHFRAPNDLVDLAMSLGNIDPTIPWIKSNVVASLIAPHATQSEGVEKISSTLKSKYPSTPKIDTAIAAAQDIYKKSFFPEMKVDWRAYPNNAGHKEWPGCFRCHDENHKTADGAKKIAASDCNACHTILAQGNGAELDKLNPKGHNFFHIDAPNEDFSCNNCHTGAFPKE
ncbi:MAG: cytochrome C [Pedosphaera sp.]|nr:cytochrome C [Pedosphaera sp.]